MVNVVVATVVVAVCCNGSQAESYPAYNAGTYEAAGCNGINEGVDDMLGVSFTSHWHGSTWRSLELLLH